MGAKQHYVPRFILRNWSHNGKQIGVYVLKNNQYIGTASISDQAQKHNFYGADQKAEEAYAQLEQSVSPVLRKIMQEDLNLSEDERLVLLLFLAAQKLRTPESYSLHQGIVRSLVESMKDFDPRLLPDYVMQNEELGMVSNAVSEHLLLSLDTFWSLLDLRLCLLKTEKQSFVLGQHPFSILNPFLIEKNWDSSRTGLSQKGTVIIMPISPTYAVCLFDRKTYGLVNHNRRVVTLDTKDLDTINLFQFYFTETCVYVAGEDSSLLYLSRNTAEYRNNDKTFTEELPLVDEYGRRKKRESLVRTYMKNVPTNESLSFLAFKEKALNEVITYQNICRDEASANYSEYEASQLFNLLHAIM